MILTTNTLYDISKHSNKTIKIADYLSKANQPLLFSSMAMVNEDSSEIAFMEAFNKDLASTTKKLEDVHQLLSTVDDEGVVIHMKGDRSLSNIFGDKYDQENQTIELPFGKVALKEAFNRDNVKKAIVEKFLDITVEEYDVLFKARKKIFNHPEDQLYSDDERIEFLSTVSERSKYDSALSAIKDMSSTYTTFRKKLTLEERSLVDDQITFQRSMVDSVIKNSTYITKNDGIVQAATGHKSQTEAMAALVKEVKNNKYIDSIELDSGTDLNAFRSLMSSVGVMKFNLDEAVCLKSRKLGNYDTKGMYYSQANIVALDVQTPSAAVHEFVHAVDYNDRNIKQSQKRQSFASKMRSHLDLSSESKNSRFKLNSTKEIIARAGEIALLLEVHDFDETKETIKEFAARVDEVQKQTEPYDLNLVHNMSYYLERPNKYFNLTELPSEDIKLVRDYFKTYFRLSEELDIAPLQAVEVPNHIPHKVVGERTRYETTNIGLITEKNIISLLEYNEKKKIIDPETLVYEIMSKPLTLNRTTKAIPWSDLSKKQNIIELMCDWAEKNDDFYLMSRIAEARVRSDSNLSAKPYFVAERLINDPKEITGHIKDHVEEFLKKAEAVYEEFSEVKYDSNVEDYKAYFERRKVVEDKYKEVLKTTLELPTNEIENYLETNPLRKVVKKTVQASKQLLNGKNQYLLSNGVNNLYIHVDNMLQKTYNKKGSEIFNYFNDKDLFPIVTMASVNSINNTNILNRNFQKFVIMNKPETKLEPYHLSKDLIGLVDRMGQLKPLIQNIEKINVNTMPSLINDARGVGSFNSIQTRQDRGFLEDDNAPGVINENAFKIVLKNAVGVEQSELSYKLASEISDNKFENYDKIQKEVNDKKASFGLITPELFVAKQGLEDIKDELIAEISKEGVLKIAQTIPEVNNNTPIDPNGKIEDKSKSKKKDNPNQFKLF